MLHVPKESAEARRKRLQKERKAEKRAAKLLVRMVAQATTTPPSEAVIKRLLSIVGFSAVAASDDCERCKAIQDRAAA